MDRINMDDPQAFSAALFEKMKAVQPGVDELELYEFRYCLDNFTPPDGWAAVALEDRAAIETRMNDIAFYRSIQIKPRRDGVIVLDMPAVQLTRMLFAGLVAGAYSPEWIRLHFYFDLRGFFFLHRTSYFTEKVIAHLGGKPYRQFEKKQAELERCPEIGYQAFSRANAEVDGAFFQAVHRLIAARGTPVLLAIAGPTAAGKTEIVARLRADFEREGTATTSVELDNFLTDREPREAKGIHTEGKEALHFELLCRVLEDLTRGRHVSTPRYNFIDGTSSHDDSGVLKPGRQPVEIDPAGVIFIEGNFPFLIPEVVHLIGIKVVYLTDDPMRFKRKWRRDIDFRRKYDPNYFCNRYFKDQFIMASSAYRPQLEVCDMAVDTTGAALWVSPQTAEILAKAG